jgi:hypothetical protein
MQALSKNMCMIDVLNRNCQRLSMLFNNSGSALNMPPQLRLNAVAFISPQNHPILIRTFSKQDELKYHYIAHTSLDVFEERG